MRGWLAHPLYSAMLASAILASSGCSHFAKIPMWHPAAAPVEGVHTVAILPFEGEWGARVSEEVSDSFSESGTYTIVSANSLPSIRTVSSGGDESPPLDQVLVAARQADIDAVLTGKIITNESSTADESRLSSGSGKSSKSPNSMTVEYRLIDTRTGETLFQNQISCLENERKSRDEAVQQTLIQRCGHEVVSQLTPQCGDCSIALANCHWMNRGVFSVRRGVRAAEAGNWESATQSWEAALRVNPKNDSAIFNLALAAASKGDYETAEEMALEAIRIQHSDCYENGLEKIRQQRTQFELADQQRSGFKLSSAELRVR